MHFLMQFFGTNGPKCNIHVCKQFVIFKIILKKQNYWFYSFGSIKKKALKNMKK